MRSDTRYGMTVAGLVPVRSEAAESVEMGTQLLLGETFRIDEETERWYRIRCDHDGYSGWVSKGQTMELAAADWLAWANHPERKRSPYATYRVENGHAGLLVPMGAPVIETPNGIEMPGGAWTTVNQRFRRQEHALLDTALHYLGTPYLWGGRSDVGLDCSGFVQSVYGLHGYALPRDAWQQAAFGPARPLPLAEAETGDLLFFSYDGKGIQHVGFYLGDGYCLHASGNVAIHTIDAAKGHGGRYLYNPRLAGTLAFVLKAADARAAALSGEWRTRELRRPVPAGS